MRIFPIHVLCSLTLYGLYLSLISSFCYNETFVLVFMNEYSRSCPIIFLFSREKICVTVYRDPRGHVSGAREGELEY